MLHYDLWGTRASIPRPRRVAEAFWRHEPVRQELHELLGVLDARSATLTRPSSLPPEIPLHVHAHVQPRRDPRRLRRGLAGAPAAVPRGRAPHRVAATDVFFVTLQEGRARLLADHAVPRLRDLAELFHWESQSTQSAARRRSSGTSDTRSATTRSCCSSVSARLWRRERLAIRLPRAGAIRRVIGLAARLVHVGARHANAGGAVRDRSHRGRGIAVRSAGSATACACSSSPRRSRPRRLSVS